MSTDGGVHCDDGAVDAHEELGTCPYENGYQICVEHNSEVYDFHFGDFGGVSHEFEDGWCGGPHNNDDEYRINQTNVYTLPAVIGAVVFFVSAERLADEGCDACKQSDGETGRYEADKSCGQDGCECVSSESGDHEPVDELHDGKGDVCDNHWRGEFEHIFH